MKHNIYIYILIMFFVTYLIRVLPLTLIRKQIKNRFLRSFLHYVPYVTLAVMTFPAIMYATESYISGIIALIVGLIFSWIGCKLLTVAVATCTTVLIIEYFLHIFS